MTREANGAAREADKGGVSGESDDEQHKRKTQQTHRMQQAHGETKAMGSGPDSAPERAHANTGKEGSDRQGTTREAATPAPSFVAGPGGARRAHLASTAGGAG